MENTNQTEGNTFSISSQSTMLKGFLIFVLTLLMLIPVPIILNLIDERSEYQENVINEIANKWSGKQIIYGPFLKIDYKETLISKEGKKTEDIKFHFVSADKNDFKGEIEANKKKRSLYEAIVYQSNLQISSSFPELTTIINQLEINQNQIESVKLVFALADPKGLDNRLYFESNGQKNYLTTDEQINLKLLTNNEKNANEKIGIFSKSIDLNDFNFKEIKFNLKLKGSQTLQFLPTAAETSVQLTSNWLDNKYDGYVLPISIHSEGNRSVVNWKIFQENPMNGQYWTNGLDAESYLFGVDFLHLNDHYDKTYRSTKYAILFIGLTFVAFFFIEKRNHFEIHLVQYALVGFAICINFVLLLSISEYLGFDWAYIISSTATVLLITYFVFGFLKSWNLTLKITMMLIVLYGFIYSILQLNEHALLVGSIGLFFILTLIMIYSRKMKWDSDK